MRLKLLLIASAVIIASVAGALALWPRSQQLPRIADSLPSNVVQASATFSARLAETFPAGSETAQLRKSLELQGFTVRNDATGMIWTGRISFWCDAQLFVDWIDENGRLTQPASGRYGLVCL